MTSGGIILAAGIAFLASQASSFWLFILSSAICGLGLSATTGASLSYLAVGECRESDRASSQGVVSLFICIGMLSGAAVFGAIIASVGEGIAGYRTAYMSLVLIALAMAVLARGLKQRHEELRTMKNNHTQTAIRP